MFSCWIAYLFEIERFYEIADPPLEKRSFPFSADENSLAFLLCKALD